MSLWRRILQGMTAFSVDTAISNLASMLSAALVFRYLDVSAYGQLTLILSFYAAATVFLDFGLNGLFIAEIARARGAGDAAWSRFLLIGYLRLNAVTCGLVLIVFLAVGYQRRDPLWAVMGCYLLTTALNDVVGVLFHSHTHYRQLAIQSITRSLVRLSLLAALPLWWRGKALLGVVWTYPITDVVTLLISAWLARTALRGARADGYSMVSLAALFRQQGIYTTLTIPIKKIADQLPVWFLKALVGDVGVGVYGAAQKGFTLVYAFFSALEATIFPLASEQIQMDKERLQIALRQIQKYTFWLGLAVAIVGNLMAHWVIPIVAGKGYLVAAPVFRLMLWLLVVYAFVQSQRPLFYALGQQKWLFVSYLVNSTVYALMLPFAVATLGVVGAAWATLFYVILSATSRMAILRWLDPWTFLDPRMVFKIEGFDRRLWEMLRMRLRRRFRNGSVRDEPGV